MKFPFKASKSFTILIVILVVGIILGLISAFENETFQWRNITSNLSTELIGAVVLYFILEKIINEGEAKSREKNSLINRMDSSNNSVAIDAIKLLYKRGWLQDGSLRGYHFNNANLENAWLSKANLSDVGFYKCNLKNADISEYQLFKLSDLRFAILPNGKKYDGRFRLKGDLDWASHKYNIDVNKADATIMANYYGVSVEEYIDGQNWANENIQKLENQNFKE